MGVRAGEQEGGREGGSLGDSELAQPVRNLQAAGSPCQGACLSVPSQDLHLTCPTRGLTSITTLPASPDLVAEFIVKF